jgi:HPt (histidine-containing phosphotransfer) domain-containing protein
MQNTSRVCRSFAERIRAQKYTFRTYEGHAFGRYGERMSDAAVSKQILVDFFVNELGEDREMFAHLYSLLSRHLEEFAASAQDNEKMATLAHKIQSGGQYFGATKLVSELQKIEQCARLKDVGAQKRHFYTALALIAPTQREIKQIAEELFAELARHG